MTDTVGNPAMRAEAAVIGVLPSSAELRRGPVGRRMDLTVNGHLFQITWIGDGRLADVRQMLHPLGRAMF